MWITIIILVLLAALVTWMVLRTRKQMKALKDVKASQKLVNLNDQNFNQKVKQGMVLVDFWAEWCMPCKLMIPVLNELAEDSDVKATIAKLNVDAAKTTASRFGIRSIPTMILFKNGVEVHRFVGVKTKDYLKKELERRSIF
jgi:thioredoxin 1